MTPQVFGKLPEQEADKFVFRYSQELNGLQKGSLSSDGMRRMVCFCDKDYATSLLVKWGGTPPVQPEPVLAPTFKLGDMVEAALSKVGITKERVSSWLGKECNCAERQEKLNKLSEWATSVFKGVKAPSPVPIPRTVVGCIHEGTVQKFAETIKQQIPGVEFGLRPTESFHRRIVDTLGHVERLTEEVIKWNGGTDRPTHDHPYIPGTWTYAVTTVPARSESFEKTLESLRAAGFDNPIVSVDGPATDASHTGYHNQGPFRHWHRTLLDLYSRNPWSQFYAIFQDDLICVKNLKQYLSSVTLPEKAYFNLFTFMENEAIVLDQCGWVEAHRDRHGRQMGRGAVALIFPHDAAEALLCSPHFITRRRDAIRGNRSLDGAVVEAMNAAGFTEYVHAPSLVQHTGEVSSIGNPWNDDPKHHRYPYAKSFPGPDFDSLTWLNNSHEPTHPPISL